MENFFHSYFQIDLISTYKYLIQFITVKKFYFKKINKYRMRQLYGRLFPSQQTFIYQLILFDLKCFSHNLHVYVNFSHKLFNELLQIQLITIVNQNCITRIFIDTHK